MESWSSSERETERERRERREREGEDREGEKKSVFFVGKSGVTTLHLHKKKKLA